MTIQRHKMNNRVIADLRKRTTFGIFFYILVFYCIYLTDNYGQRHPQLAYLFLVIFAAICLFRLLHLYFSAKAPARHEKLHHNIFLTSAILNALAWGAVAAYISIQTGEEKVQSLMTICTAGLCAGGVISFIPERRLSILYNILMFLPTFVTILIQGNNPTLAAAILIYSSYLILLSLRGNIEYWTALENELLLEKQSAELKQASRIDVLTNIYNRRHFDELFHLTLGLCARRETPITLIIFDIDNFKTINDAFGHLAGDEYLKRIGRSLKVIFRRDTDVVGRYGGDEFVILLPDENTSATWELAECFRQDVAGTVVDYNGEKIATTVSLGMTCCIPKVGQSPESVIEAADRALYKAKNSGRNRIVIDGEC